MTVLAPENRDEITGPSPCCPEANLRYSEPLHASYCENCETWDGEPWVEPAFTGPTWQRGEDGEFILPQYTLGWDIIDWAETWLNDPKGAGRWQFTGEQIRFMLWFYAVNPDGTWLYREATLQRMKGWGKDPLGAVICLAELLGPCRFDYFDGDTPVGMENEAAWVQVMATSKSQNDNTMKMLPILISDDLKRGRNLKVGIQKISVIGTARFLESVTSNPATREGNRPSFQIGNEPHWWKHNNQGHEMRAVMDRNLKEPGARILWLTNAYNPSEDSVGQANREGWEDMSASRHGTEVMYDSLEAPANARLRPNEILTVLKAVAGDAWWIQFDVIRERILDSRNSQTESRRFYYNQIQADEEHWLDPEDVDATVAAEVLNWRKDPDIDTTDRDYVLRVGWARVDPKDKIVMFGDGGKGDDHTALSGYRLSDGYTFAIGQWGRPANMDDRLPWSAPRQEVDARVVEAMDRFNVVAFWFDPSHTKDEDDSPYWDGTCDLWHRRYKDDLQVWAIKTGDRQHSVKWDMSNPAHQEMFVHHAEQFQHEITERTLTHDGHPTFVRYMKNAKQYLTKYGWSLYKGSRGSKRKIDGAVTHVGARMLGQIVLNRADTDEPQKQGWWK